MNIKELPKETLEFRYLFEKLPPEKQEFMLNRLRKLAEMQNKDNPDKEEK